MTEPIKKFLLRIWNEVENHLAKYIAAFIIIAFLVVCIAFCRWMVVKHSLELYGWLWILIPSLVVALSVLIFWLATRQKILYESEGDIKNILRKWLTHHVNKWKQSQYTLYFSTIDKKEKLSPGSAKKYLEPIITEQGLYSIISASDETICIRRRRKPQTKQPGFLDNLY